VSASVGAVGLAASRRNRNHRFSVSDRQSHFAIRKGDRDSARSALPAHGVLFYQHDPNHALRAADRAYLASRRRTAGRKSRLTGVERRALEALYGRARAKGRRCLDSAFLQAARTRYRNSSPRGAYRAESPLGKGKSMTCLKHHVAPLPLASVDGNHVHARRARQGTCGNGRAPDLLVTLCHTIHCGLRLRVADSTAFSDTHKPPTFRQMPALPQSQAKLTSCLPPKRPPTVIATATPLRRGTPNTGPGNAIGTEEEDSCFGNPSTTDSFGSRLVCVASARHQS